MGLHSGLGRAILLGGRRVIAVLLGACLLWGQASAATWVSWNHAYGCGCGGQVFNITGSSKENVCQQAAAHASSCGCLPPQHPTTASVFTVQSYRYVEGEAAGSCWIEDMASAGSTWDLVPFSNALVETDQTQSDRTRCPRFGNPILPLTGAKVDVVQSGLSLGGLDLVLTYQTTNKLPASQTDADTALAEQRSFGALWRSTFHRRLAVSIGQKAALVSRGDGTVASFSGNGSGGFTAAGGHVHKLVSLTGGYRFTDSATGEIDTFDAGGKLLAVEAASGAVLSFSYAGDNLIRVRSSEGRTIRFAYGSNGLVSQITGPDAGVIAAAYDASQNLTSLTWSDGKVLGFLYENTNVPWAMTGKVDEKNTRFATFAYDVQGRAISTEYAGGVNRFAVTYGTAPVRTVTDNFDATNGILYRTRAWNAPTGTTVTQPNGQTTALDAQLVAGAPLMTSQSQSAGSGCAAAISSQTYDSSGNVLSRDDFQGVRTCYAYDTSNRETVRVEGLPNTTTCSSVMGSTVTLPTGARKITTDWHPDWEMATQVVQPLRKSSTVYHGQPDPFNSNATASCSSAQLRSDGKPLALACKQVEQALLGSGAVDTSVPGRTSTYTYDGTGRVLSSVNPRGQTTTYAYYTDTAFAGGGDPSYGSLTLLLHGNGTNGSTAITDSGPLQLGLTAVGDVNISTGQSKFGGTAIAFDGSGDYLRIPYSPDLAFGAGDFTIETFIYKNANNGNYSRIWNADGDYYDGVTISIDPSGNFAVYVTTTGTGWSYSLPAVANLANGQWYHLAVVRSGGSMYAFVNGVRSIITTALGTAALYSNTGTGRVIGGQSGVDRALNGYVDEFRITKGVARYTANFTPPAQAFADGGATASDDGHTAGDLQSVTNAQGHVTTVNAYSPAGRARQMTDAKGIVTDITYAPRGWVSTMTTTAPGGTGYTTTYTYDDVGQVTQVTQPDGTTLSFSYDAAHRLVGVTDTRGNAATYTLDNMGNRVAEELRDPTGALHRAVNRSFDALSRLQQSVGASQ
ncbi:LamG-like jellyroll fold domain-containing protein [Ramlibacter sp.]|uniref:LamG-like jellyroll fold domain-containing protein n=1 Tax=Ramlibacter sp. TaxID=1917967 RepID=UPI00182B277C|nr:LamG-like jellyroll fold domain-containing protein [Ramlibacter sp.]MBA2672392.1 hypothetical protein [Ramlibacter sp.]